MLNKWTNSCLISIKETLLTYSNISKKLFESKLFTVFDLISLVIDSLEKWEIYSKIILFCIQGEKSRLNNLNKLTLSSSGFNLSKYNCIISNNFSVFISISGFITILLFLLFLELFD